MRVCVCVYVGGNTNRADLVKILHLLKLLSENDLLVLASECGQGINSEQAQTAFFYYYF